ncbi:MAG: UDP-N-acetylmuramoyl-tripeptide--D-alanyl-D-alanine ligase [Chitinophagaceae bacterium]
MEISNLYTLYQQYPSVQTDTRKIQEGDIFFALRGPSFNGNSFAHQALQSGASFAVIDDPEFKTDERCILVDDVLRTLQALAQYHRRQFNIPFIAITGSNGKTTSKELVTTVLSRKYRTYATEGNLNNHIGVPLTILKIHKDAEIAVIEMGANHQREIASYCEIALPDYAIINNCGKAHLEGFGGIEGVRRGKGELYDFIRINGGTIFINSDLDYLQEMAAGIENRVSYGSANATYTGSVSDDSITLRLQANAPGYTIEIKSNLVGDYNFANLMLAFAAGNYFDVDKADIKAALENYYPDNSRSQLVEKGTNRVILDAYNANPTSMRAAIDNFAGLTGSNKMLWLGAMKEMGDAEAAEHQDLVEYIGRWDWTSVILVGKEFEPFRGKYHWFPDSAEAAAFVSAEKPEHSLILIKGSRGSKMERIYEVL